MNNCWQLRFYTSLLEIQPHFSNFQNLSDANNFMLAENTTGGRKIDLEISAITHVYWLYVKQFHNIDSYVISS